MPSVSTPLCSALGIEHPVVQAPVGSVSTPALAGAVADAGGLGLLAMSWRDRASIREAFRAATDGTDGVVGVNVVLDESTGVLSPANCLDACLDAGASVVSFSFGDAAPFIDRVHDRGGTVLVSVGTTRGAREAVAAGADILVVQGSEAGGHLQSDVSTLALLPRVTAAVDVPVVAAGGISDGRGLAAALALGADGGWLGTRFVATRESGAHRAYKQRLADGTESSTRRTTQFDVGWPDQPHRVLETTESKRSADRATTDASDPVARTADGDPVERNADVPPLEGMSGELSELPHYAGQSVGGVDGIPPAGDVVASVVADAVRALDDASDTIVR